MEKSLKSIFAAAAFVLALSSCTQNDVHKMRTISVSGTGKVFVTPDKASVNFSVITRDSDIKLAQEENASAMRRIQDALSSQGIPAGDIQTSDYGITQESYWKDGEQFYGKYCVTNRIKVTVKDVEKASDVIDVAVRNGATGVDGLSLSYEDEAQAVKRARTLAIENARAIAEESVSAAGTRLGKVLVMEEKKGYRGIAIPSVSNYVSQTWTDDDVVYSDVAGGEVPISGGKKEISVVMNITYELR
ncbi:MAG: SIMPL domain-containing protein [Treponema sp.]|nr:SIMPL domain-containing protein [Treponema sp.]